MAGFGACGAPAADHQMTARPDIERAGDAPTPQTVSRDEVVAIVDEAASMLARAVAELRRRPATPCGDWVSAFSEGDAIGTDHAAFIDGSSAQTVRRDAKKAAAAGKPIGIWIAQSVWLISKSRLLDAIEERDGRHGRLEAESRAAKYAQMSARQQNSLDLEAPQQAQG
jgi:hypothetical protein